MATQQDIIKKFMKSLDDAKNWTASGAGGIGGAINAAIKDASGDKFESLDKLAKAFLEDCKNSPDVDTFLREKCGIIIDNEDTGSVTGFDMGGTKIKTEESIVPEVNEVIRLDNEYREQQIANPNQETFELDGDNVTVDANGTLSFTKKGLTVKFYDYDELIEAANSTDETTRSEAENKLVVINGLYTWWIEGALKLIAESYGDNYGFDDKSDAKVREIKLELEFKEADRRNAYVNYNVLRAGLLLPQTLWINMAHFVGIDSSNFNGKISSEFSSVEYLDSDIAHELTHAVMNANIDKHAPGTTLLGEFPILLKDGMAELTRGIDNYRKDYIIGGIAEYKNSSDPDSTDFGIVMNNLLKSNYYQDDRAYYQYVGGYMLMHYLAKQCADEEFSGINVRTTENQTETALMLTGQRFTANNGTALVSAGDKIKTDENNNITEITIGKSDNIISTPESKTPVIVKNRKGEVLASIIGSASVHENGYIHKNLSDINVASEHDNITVTGGNGDDTVAVGGSGNNVDGNEGDDSFSISGNGNTVTGNNGDDSFSVSGSGNEIYGNNGDDIFSVSGNDNTVTGNNGNDSFSISGNGNRVIGNEGDDSFSVNGNDNTVNGNDGNDTFSISGSGNDIGGGNGDDIFSVSGSGNYIDGGAGKDQFIFSAEAKDNTLKTFNVSRDKIQFAASEISAEKETDNDGNETIAICSGQDTLLVINSTDGTKAVNDNIFYDNGKKQTTLEKLLLVSAPVFPDKNTGDTKTNKTFSVSGDDTIYGTDGDDSFSVSFRGSNNLIYGGDGDDSFSIVYGSYYNTIYGEAGDDIFFVSACNNTVTGNEGNDVFSISGRRNDIAGGEDDDSFSVSGSDNTIYGENGDDSFTVSGNGNSIDGGNGDDTFSVSSVNKFYKCNTIHGDDGNDAFFVSGECNIIYGDKGGDTFSVSGDAKYNTIYGGEGENNFSVSGKHNTINGGEGENNFSVDGEFNIIYGGKDNDAFSVSGSGNKIDGDEGNDTFSVSGSDSHIAGGKGDDTFFVDAVNELRNYNLVSGDKGDDTFSVGGSSNLIDGGEGNDIFSVSGNSNRLIGGEGVDIFSVSGSGNEIDGGYGKDSFDINGDDNVIKGEAGDDIFSISGNGNRINGGIGDDTFSVSGSGNYISDDEYIYGYNGKDQFIFTAEAKNNTLERFDVSGDEIQFAASEISAEKKTDNAGYEQIIICSAKDTLLVINITAGTTSVNDNIFYDNGKKQTTLEKLLVPASTNDATTRGGGSSTSTTGGGSSTSTTTGGGSSTSTTGGGSSTSTTTGDGASTSTTGDGASTSTTGGGYSTSTSKSGNSSTSTVWDNFFSTSKSSGSSSTSTTRSTSFSGSTATRSGNSSSSTTTGSSSTSTTRGGSSSTSTTTGSSSTSTTRGGSLSSTVTASQNIYTGGDKTISNYSGQAVTLGAYTGATFDENGNFFVGSSTGTLVIQNAKDKIVDLRDGRGNAFIKAYTPSTAGVIDGRGLAGYEIIYGAANGTDVIFAGDGGSQLWGGSGLDADALVGGAGSDIFICGRLQGSDNIFNASSADAVNLTDASLSDIVATAEVGNNVLIGFNTGNIINIQSTELLSAAINFADGSSLRFNHVTKSWQGA